MTRFSTISDARAYVIDAIGTTAPDFDIDAIVYEVFTRDCSGAFILDDDADFWGIVEEHDISE